MTREIKFRAWSDSGQLYKDVAPHDNREAIIKTAFCAWASFYADSIEQYTGLKDKNGKEIYEGDIIKCWSQNTYPVGRVMYSEEWCTYEIVSYDPKECRVYNLESFSPTVNKYLEVIGNIHENPELLEKGTK